MFNYLVAQLQAQSPEEVIEEVFQDVLPATITLLLIGVALLLAVFLLRVAAKVNALPQKVTRASPSKEAEASSADSSEHPASSSEVSTNDAAQIELHAQTYQSVSVRWTIPREMAHELRQDSRNSLMIRLLDVTQIDLSAQLPHAIYDYPCNWGKEEGQQVMGIAVVQGDRDYIAELGYMTAERQWRQLARSTHVRVESVHE